MILSQWLRHLNSCKWLKYTLYASHIVLNTLYSITQQSNGKMGEPQALIFCENISKKLKIPPCVCFYGHIMVCGQHYKSSKWFLCTTYDLKHVIKYHTAMGRWESYRYFFFMKIDQKCSKFPLTSDFMAISGSVDSTLSLVYGLYVSPMVSNTS